MGNAKDQYSSKLGAIITMVGVAVGLGNVWRFPYMMGSYGGGTFLLIYLVFTILFAYPALVMEMWLGRVNRAGVITAFQSLFKKRFGKVLGYFLIGVATIASSYYAVVIANLLYSSVFSVVEGFSEATNENYHHLLENGLIQYGFTVLLIIGALSVSYLGLNKGIERLSKIIIPLFLLSILYMIGYAWLLPNAVENVKGFLAPNFDAIGSSQVFAALGQAFFSVGLGGTYVVIYSGFIKKSKDIPQIAFFTCMGDIGSSLLVSLFLVPCILAFGMEMDAGPSLLFNTLPELFAVLPAGKMIGSLFLISLSLVAFLSLIAAFQVPISSLKAKVPLKKLIIGFGILQLIITFPSALFPQIIGPLDLIFGSGMQIFGSLLVLGGMWWGVKRGFYRKIMFKNPKGLFAKLSIFWLRWIIPIVLLSVLIGYIYENIM